MKIYAPIAVLITFIAASFCFAPVNYALLGGGGIVSILVFFALRHNEIEDRSKANEMNQLLDAVKLQAAHHQEVAQNLIHLTKVVTDLSAGLDNDLKKIIMGQESLKNELIAVQKAEIGQIIETTRQNLEQHQKANAEISNTIREQALTLHELVDQLMAITSQMSESKDVVREQILRMQEAYVNELRQRVRA
ncbi:hypothetical protein [Paenibacillus sp. FSL W8-0194]|uniref:hypothetical protein n=1 Tax=Paenibacillus sp. FSL W8-0194 TaxID=2921711 RepID=UPI0030D9C27E